DPVVVAAERGVEPDAAVLLEVDRPDDVRARRHVDVLFDDGLSIPESVNHAPLLAREGRPAEPHGIVRTWGSRPHWRVFAASTKAFTSTASTMPGSFFTRAASRRGLAPRLAAMALRWT